MNKGKYPCNIFQHIHNSRQQRDRCKKAYRLHLLHKKNQPRQQDVQRQIQMRKENTKKAESSSDCSLTSDDQAEFMIYPSDKSFLINEEKNVKVNVNQMLMDFDLIAAKKAADQFIKQLKSNQISQDYLLWTDEDKQWIPNYQYKNWKLSIHDQQQVKKDPQKPYIRRQFKKQLKKQFLKIKEDRRSNKEKLGRILQSNRLLLTFYDTQSILKFLPTQIPLINLGYRQQEREKYRKLEEGIQALYLQTDCLISNKNMEIRKRINFLNKNMQTLNILLRMNIFDKRCQVGFHYQEIKFQVEQEIVSIWLILKDFPQPFRPIISNQELNYFADWMGYALPKYNHDYCLRNGLITPSVEQQISQRQKQKDLYKKKSQLKLTITSPRVEKYYKNWDELAHELGYKHRKEHNKLQCQSISTKESPIKAIPKLDVPMPNLELFREYRNQKLDKYLENCKSSGLYTRPYFRTFNKIFFISPVQEIRLYEKVYQLHQMLDPVCRECDLEMQIKVTAQFIDFQCRCGHKWKKSFKKLRQCKEFKIIIELNGKQQMSIYKSITRSDKRNNFHEYCYHWMRRAKYSNEIPFKLKTKIPIFSNKTNLQIEYNREEENYLPLEIFDSIIPGAGKGMRTTQFIKKGSLIITYVGYIKPHYEVRYDNKSIFSLGIIDTKDNVAVVIDPVDQGNAAKYINTSYGKYVNCKTEIGIFKPRVPDLPEPAIILIATKDIMPGHELFYEYGIHYGNFIRKRKQKK